MKGVCRIGWLIIFVILVFKMVPVYSKNRSKAPIEPVITTLEEFFDVIDRPEIVPFQKLQSFFFRVVPFDESIDWNRILGLRTDDGTVQTVASIQDHEGEIEFNSDVYYSLLYTQIYAIVLVRNTILLENGYGDIEARKPNQRFYDFSEKLLTTLASERDIAAAALLAIKNRNNDFYYSALHHLTFHGEYLGPPGLIESVTNLSATGAIDFDLQDCSISQSEGAEILIRYGLWDPNLILPCESEEGVERVICPRDQSRFYDLLKKSEVDKKYFIIEEKGLGREDAADAAIGGVSNSLCLASRGHWELLNLETSQFSLDSQIEFQGPQGEVFSLHQDELRDLHQSLLQRGPTANEPRGMP